MEVWPRPPLAGRKILIAVEGILEAEEIRCAVQATGGSVSGPVASVETALWLLQHDRPDAAVLGVVLSRLLSIPIAERLLDLDVPFVVVSGYPKPHLPPPLNTVPYVSKPFFREEVIEALARTMGLTI
jgi:two-component SAPR family response regulator